MPRAHARSARAGTRGSALDRVSLAVLIAGFALLGGAVVAEPELAARPAAPSRAPASPARAPATAEEVEAVVRQYCVVCHAGATPAAGLALDRIDWANPGAHAASLEKVVRKLRFETMPPAGMPRPEPSVYAAVTEWIESGLDGAWSSTPKPGTAGPVHRLNRLEYNNAINDLLGIDVDVVGLLPGDPTADGGFDNMAEALPFSTAYLERYMSVARQATRLAVGLPPDGPGVTTYEVPLHVVQDWRQSEELPFGSRGGIAVEHQFPVGGDYSIRVRLRENWQDYIMGLGWPQRLQIRIDGRLVHDVTIGGDAPGVPAPMSFSGPGAPGSTDWENYMFAADEGLEVTVPVPAGPHEVGVSYVRERLQPEDVPQPEQRGRLLANDEVYMDYQQVELLEIGGPYGAAAAVGDTPGRRAIFSCHPAGAAEDRACATEILSRLGRRALRRPLEPADVERLLGFFERGKSEGRSFDAGIQFALEYLLSDPEFLVRIYRAPAGTAAGAGYPLTDLQLATRLSFFLWSTLPDETLLAAAERGELSRRDVLEREARRLLADPRATDMLTTNFAAQWLNLRRISEIVVDPELYPNYDQTLLDAFREETTLFVANGIREDRSVVGLLDADFTFVNERLARHYGIPGVYGSRFRRVELPDLSQRGGLLGQGSILAVTSYPGRTSPVLRGKWLLDNILGTPPPPPPPNVPLLPGADAEGGRAPATMRERLAEHRTNPVCASCHSTIDPLGFALENFDVIGGWRTIDESGAVVDAQGTWPAGERLDGLTGLRSWLLAHPERFVHTLTEKLMAYALGRRVEFYDEPTVRWIVRDAASDGYRWSDLVVGIVLSPAFSSSSAGAATAN